MGAMLIGMFLGILTMPAMYLIGLPSIIIGVLLMGIDMIFGTNLADMVFEWIGNL